MTPFRVLPPGVSATNSPRQPSAALRVGVWARAMNRPERSREMNHISHAPRARAASWMRWASAGVIGGASSPVTAGADALAGFVGDGWPAWRCPASAYPAWPEPAAPRDRLRQRDRG